MLKKGKYVKFFKESLSGKSDKKLLVNDACEMKGVHSNPFATCFDKVIMVLWLGHSNKETHFIKPCKWIQLKYEQLNVILSNLH